MMSVERLPKRLPTMSPAARTLSNDQRVRLAERVATTARRVIEEVAE
jgi:hypothetical protein